MCLLWPPALVGYGDLTCIQIDRFNEAGSKSKSKLTLPSRVCLPFYIMGHLELDYVPRRVVALPWHLGKDARTGHYCAAIKEGNQWWLYDDHQRPSQVYHHAECLCPMVGLRSRPTL